MAQECALFYDDANGIQGDNTITSQDREGTSEVYEVHHAVSSPMDLASGRARGRRQHEPLRVLKPIDKATPQLFQTLCQNAMLPKLILKWYRPNPADGTTEEFFTVTLTEASVRKVELNLPNTRDAEEMSLPPLEWVEFSYRRITYTHVDGSIEYEDAWIEAV